MTLPRQGLDGGAGHGTVETGGLGMGVDDQDLPGGIPLEGNGQRAEFSGTSQGCRDERAGG
jgi:hypothetical protein